MARCRSDQAQRSEPAPDVGREARGHRLDGVVDLGFGQRPIVAGEVEPEREALLVVGRAAARGRCRTARPTAGAARRGAGWTPRPRRPAGPRRRRPRGRARRPGGATAWRRGIGRAGRREARRSRAPPTTTRSARSSSVVDDARVELADPARDVPSRRRPGRARPGMEARIVGQRRRTPARARPRPRGDAARSRPFASSRSYGRARPVPGRRSRRRPSSAKPRRHHSWVGRPARRRCRSPCRSRRSRRRRALAQVGRDDLEQAAEQALAHHRVLARQRVRDGDRCAARRLLGLAGGAPIVAPAGTARPSRARRARRSRPRCQAGAGERLADRVADPERRSAGTAASACAAGSPGRSRSRGPGRPPR